MEENNEELEYNKVKIISNAISIALGITISVVVLVALYIVGQPTIAERFKSEIFTEEQLERLEAAARIIDEDYLYEYDLDKLIDGAIEGMVDSLENVFTYYEN